MGKFINTYRIIVKKSKETLCNIKSKCWTCNENNKPYYEFKFIGLFPTNISAFIMNSSDGPDNILTADATFRYSYYDIKKLF